MASEACGAKCPAGPEQETGKPLCHALQHVGQFLFIVYH
jgi:hypothetical protein